jgi:hypothetical protein
VGRAALLDNAIATAVPVKRASPRAVPVAWTDGSEDAHLPKTKKPTQMNRQSPITPPIIQSSNFRLLDGLSGMSTLP